MLRPAKIGHRHIRSHVPQNCHRPTHQLQYSPKVNVSANNVSSFSFYKKQTITETAYLYMTEICLTPRFEENCGITFCSQKDGALS